jgi:RNA polymerase sigma factor (sigma-70 family)
MQPLSMRVSHTRMGDEVLLIFDDVKMYLRNYLSEQLAAGLEECETVLEILLDDTENKAYRQIQWEKLAATIFTALRIPIATERDIAKRNFGLTRLEFEKLRNELKSGSQQLFEKVFLTHFDQCKRYIRNAYTMSDDDAYDLTMDTLVEFQRILRDTERYSYGNLCYMFTLKAVQDYIKKKNRKKQLHFVPTAILPETADEEMLQIEEVDIQRMEIALDKMCEDCRYVLTAYYYDGIQLKDIANKLNIRADTLRQRKKECIKKMRTLFFQNYTV